MSNIVLITGANTGIGFETVKALAGSNQAYTILLGGRSLEKVKTAVAAAKKEFPSSASTLVPIQIDIESDDSIESAFAEVQSKFGKLDVLVNNAGKDYSYYITFLPYHLNTSTRTNKPSCAQFDQLVAAGKLGAREMWNRTWNVNTTSTHIMTSTFAPLLLKSSDPRLLFLAYGTSSLAGTENAAIPVNKVPPKGWPKTGFSVPAYRSAKTGLNMVMREWYRWLKEDGVKVFAVSPGFLATGLGGNPEASKKIGALEPSVAGPFILSIIEGKRDADVGKVINKDGVQTW